MLANTNALGQPVACMRFMGGREFARTGRRRQPTVHRFEAPEELIARGTMALPCFAERRRTVRRARRPRRRAGAAANASASAMPWRRCTAC
jgi:hypothetical protein